MGRISPAVLGLLIANAVFFGVGVLWGRPPGLAHGPLPMESWFALWFPGNDHFAAWQLVTYMFMHGGLAHIVFNMFALLSFGPPLELTWGRPRFLSFFFVCGVGAGAIYAAVNWIEFHSLYHRLVQGGIAPSDIQSMLDTGKYVGPFDPPTLRVTMVSLYRIYNGPMVGASGAIYGVLVAFGLLYPNARLALMFLPVPIAAKIFIPILLALDLFSSVTGFSLFGGGIAHVAHLGGAAIGFLLAWYWRVRPVRSAASQSFE